MTKNSAFKQQARALAERENIPYAEARTRVLNVADALIQKALGPDRVSWTGRTPDPGVPEHHHIVGHDALCANEGGPVQVMDRSGALVRDLPHYPLHSPSGFGWADTGPGSADLARAILIAVLGDQAFCVSCAGTGQDDEGTACFCEDGIGVSPSLSRQFMVDVVAKMPKDEPWTLEVYQVQWWLHQQAFIIQEGPLSDDAIPYPLSVLPSGEVLGQDFWRGRTYWMIGAVPDIGAVRDQESTPLRDRAEVLQDPEGSHGHYLVTADHEGQWGVHPSEITSIRLPRTNATG